GGSALLGWPRRHHAGADRGRAARHVERQAGPVRMGELYRAAPRECGAQLLPDGLDPFRRHGNRPPEACGEPGLSDSETPRERGGGIESVPQIDKVYVALEEDLIHWCAGL